MLTTDDKIRILKSVRIFAETPDTILTEVIPILEQLSLSAGDRVFAKGDLGTCMYIIVEGRVRVHDGDMLLNYLATRDVFGEMALLDPEPRLASVTAIEDTLLFRLDADPFYALMDRRGEISRGIIRTLCQHLRARVRDMAEDFEYMRQFAKVTAAANAVEAGFYEPESLDEVALRTDALGQLARVFQRMVRQVDAREQQLKRELSELKIEIDQARQERQVAEITETDYFQQLQAKVHNLRRKAR